jgi:hypothetical protein
MITAPDIQQASRFLEAIDPGANSWTFQTFDDVKIDGKPRKLGSLTHLMHGTLEKCAPQLAALSAKGAGVFVTVNETDGHGRMKENIVRIRALFADFDKTDPSVPDRLRADLLPPSIIVESSPEKWHAYWLVDDLALNEFKTLQKRIIAEWDTDTSVHDLPRVMRLPGFPHQKYNPQPVRLIEVTGRRYGRELVDRYKPAPAAKPERPKMSLTALTALTALTPYGAAALAGAFQTVEGTAEGGRNATLNTEAFRIGQLVAGGEIPRELARERLGEAAEIAGLPRAEAQGVIARAFGDGAKQPRKAPTLDVDQWLDDLDEESSAALPLLPEIAEPLPYPVDALPSLMRDAVHAIAEHVMVPLALAGQCVIGAAAHMAQTRANAWDPSGAPEGAPCSLFLLTLAVSGDGKSSVRRLAFLPIDQAEKNARTQYRLDCQEIKDDAGHLKGKALEEYLAARPLPADPRTQYGDATFEPIAGDFIRGKPAASWDTDEGGQMLGGASLKAETVRATLGGLTKAFDSGTFERTRSRGNVEGSGIAYNRRLSVHLLAQPATVEEALKDPLLREQGFLPRFLFASPASLAGTRFITEESLTRKAHDDPRLRRYWTRCEEFMNSREHIDPVTGEVKPPVILLGDAARRLWITFRNEIEAESGPLGSFVNLRAFANRGAQQALRLATVLACFEGAKEISGECMTQACKLVRYSLGEWLRYTDSAPTDPVRQQAIAFMDWVRHPSRAANWVEFNRSKAGKSGPAAMRKQKDRDKVLDLLVKHRYLLTSDGKQFRINPIAPASAGVAQPSANLPQSGSGGITELPQIPQIPQLADMDAYEWDDLEDLIGLPLDRSNAAPA